MKINSSEYAVSAVREDQYPKDDLPEIALAGRSNVGKSSLINTLVNRKNLARTSSQPGKTQTLNFYLVNKSFYLLVDSRHVPSKDDQSMYEYAQYLNLPILVVCTKIDKLKKSQLTKVKANLKKVFDLSYDNVSVLTFSSVTKNHVTELSDWIQEKIAE